MEACSHASLLFLRACMSQACCCTAELRSEASDDELGEEDLAEEEAPPFYKRPRFWRIAIPTAITLCAMTIGLLLTFVPSFHVSSR